MKQSERKYDVAPESKKISPSTSMSPFWTRPMMLEKDLPLEKYPLANRIKIVDKELEELDDCFSKILKFCYK